MKKIMKKVLSVIMVLALLLVPMTVMAATGDSQEEAWQLGVTTGPMDRLAVTVAAGGLQWVQAADANGTVEVGYATGDYLLVNGPLNQVSPETESGNYTATLVLSGYKYFTISNPGETDVTVYMTLTAGAAAETTGTMDDPQVVTMEKDWFGNLGAYIETELAEGNQGYFYKVVAPADGLLAVRVNAMDADYNFIGWQYNVTNSTIGKYGDNHWSDDEEPVSYEEWVVSEGDEIVVFASTYDPASWTNPAGNVIVEFSFNAVGSQAYPEALEAAGDIATVVTEGSMGYYYEWTAPATGEITVTMNDEAGWTYAVNNLTSYVYGDTHWSDDETVVASETVKVNAGDTIQVMVNTYDPASWSAPAGTINWTLDFEPVAANFAIDDTTAYVGKEFDVVVKINDNPGIISAKLDIGYDADVLELVGVKEGDLTATTESAGEEVSCYNYSEDYTANPYAVNWIDALSEENNTTNGTFVTLTFKVKDEAAAGDTQITIDYNPNNVFDKDLNNVEFNVVNATVTVKNHLPGDVNSDGVVNNRDYALLMQYLNKWEVTINEAAADVTGDGDINNRDYALLMQYLNKWEVVLK